MIVKIMRLDNSGRDDQDPCEYELTQVIECNRYQVTRRQGIGFVTTYMSQHDDLGIEWMIGNDGVHQGYDVCYIENEKGKTIDKVGPYHSG